MFLSDYIEEHLFIFFQVSPTSRSIWRSPPMEILPTRNIAPKPNQPNPPDNLQSLFNMAKCTGQTSLQVRSFASALTVILLYCLFSWLI